MGLQKSLGRRIFIWHVSSIKNDFKKGDALSSLLFSFALEYAITRIHENLENLKLNVSHRLLVYTDDVNADILKRKIQKF
jgi:hypothetical protein